VSAPLWHSGFRPFFLGGALYGPVLVALWYGARHGAWVLTGGVIPLPMVHAHELLFGFAVAIVCGVLLTALPSWTGARELRGARLALLAGLWLAGRVAFLFLGKLPITLVMVIDCALLPVLGAMVVPTLSGARWRLFFWSLPPLVGLAAGNVAFYLAAARGSLESMRWSLELGIDALAFLYSLYGGLLVPAFTRNFLRARGQSAAGILLPLEYATALAMVAYAAADLGGAPPAWMAATALGACALHLWRCLRWRGWRTAGEPLLWTLHLGYVWFIFALALRAWSALNRAVPADAWIHAFTLGALGLTMASLMTRVALRHTGRALRVRTPMRAAYFAVLAAALLRLGYAERAYGEWAILGSALLWSGCFLTYAALYGPMLLAPSLARAAGRVTPPTA